MEKRDLALVRDEDLDLQSFSGIAEAKRRGLLPERFNQSREDFERAVAASDAENFAKLRSGERQPISTRRLDCDPRTGVYTSQFRRRGGEWSPRRIVAVSRTRTSTAAVAVRARGPRGTVRRPRARRRTTRARAPSRASGEPGEPGPGPDDGPGDHFTTRDAQSAADHLAALYVRYLTPARFYASTEPCLFGLDPEQLGPARLAIFLELPPEQQRSFYRHLSVPRPKGEGTP